MLRFFTRKLRSFSSGRNKNEIGNFLGMEKGTSFYSRMICMMFLLIVFVLQSFGYNIELIREDARFSASAIVAEFTPNDVAPITNATLVYVKNACDKQSLSDFGVHDSVKPLNMSP